MSYQFDAFPQQGWQCPICNRVYAPGIPMCFYCGNKQNATNKTSNIETPITEKEFLKKWATEKNE